MTCRELAELLLEYAAGELEAEYFAQFEEHMHVCPGCEALVHSYQVTIQIGRRLPKPAMRKEFAQRLEELLRRIEE